MADPPLFDLDLPLNGAAPFTRRAALEAGLTDNQLGRLCRNGHLRRMFRSVYVAAHLVDNLWVRAQALSLVIPDGAFVTDHTAAWLHCGDLALPPNAHLSVPNVSVFRPPSQGRMRTPISTSGERTLRPEDLMTIHGIAVTTPLRTGLDIGRFHQRDVAMWGIDLMHGTGTFTHEEFMCGVKSLDRQRGVVQLRNLAPMADGKSQSFGESGLRLRWHDAGLPRPRCQVPVEVDGHVIFWLDMGLEDIRFGAEYDGAAWHTSEHDVAHDARRRDWLDRERSWLLEVFRKESVFGHHQDATERLAHAYRAARASFHRRAYFL